jgi:hypothetical protein
MNSQSKEIIKDCILLVVAALISMPLLALVGSLFLLSQYADDYSKTNGEDEKGKKVMREVAIQQAKEYIYHGKFITEFKFQGYCYDGKSIISPDRTQVTNYLIRKSCSSDKNDNSSQYIQKLFGLPNSYSPKTKVAVVKCSSPYYPGVTNSDNNPNFFNGSNDPDLVGGVPKCPDNVYSKYRKDGGKVSGSVYYPLRGCLKS